MVGENNPAPNLKNNSNPMQSYFECYRCGNPTNDPEALCRTCRIWEKFYYALISTVLMILVYAFFLGLYGGK